MIGGALETEVAEAATIDPTWLGQLAEAEGVVIEVSKPGLAEYSRDLGEAISYAINDWLAGWVPGVGSVLAPLAPTILKALLIILGITVAFILIRRWLSPGPAKEEVRQVVELASGSVSEARSPVIWAAELARSLEAGQIADALAALWWWLASQITSERVDPTWTSRELLRQAGRRDLQMLADRLDRLMYGPEVPGREQVSVLFQELREAVE